MPLNKADAARLYFGVGRKGATPAQLEALYRARFEQFARFAAAVCRDGELGRDAVQAAFAIALRERGSFRGTGQLDAWVWRIVVNEARRLRRTRVEPSANLAEPPANGSGGDELGIRGWLATLPERQREAVFLRYYADLDYRSIAEALGVELGTVSATLAAAHHALRKKLEEVRP